MEGFSEGYFIDAGLNSLVFKPKYDSFSGQVPDKIIVGHGTTTESAYGAIKTLTARPVGGRDAFYCIARIGMQVGAPFYMRITS